MTFTIGVYGTFGILALWFIIYCYKVEIQTRRFRKHAEAFLKDKNFEPDSAIREDVEEGWRWLSDREFKLLLSEAVHDRFLEMKEMRPPEADPKNYPPVPCYRLCPAAT